MYIVKGMTLITQTERMSCWYASAQMLITWRRNDRQASEEGIWDPSEDVVSEGLKAKDQGIRNEDIIALARRLGLEPVPPQSPTAPAIAGWLRLYGPLWVNGRSHIVVIGGIVGDNVLVYDPAPQHRDGPEWRSLGAWYYGASSPSSRDTSKGVPAVFLHCPSASPRASIFQPTTRISGAR